MTNTRASDSSALAGVPRGLPAWKRALWLQQRAAATGFEWTDPQPVLDTSAASMHGVHQWLDAAFTQLASAR